MYPTNAQYLRYMSAYTRMLLHVLINFLSKFCTLTFEPDAKHNPNLSDTLFIVMFIFVYKFTQPCSLVTAKAQLQNLLLNPG